MVGEAVACARLCGRRNVYNRNRPAEGTDQESCAAPQDADVL